MSLVIAFIPPKDKPFSFIATYDGTSYNNVITWSLAGQRWMLNIYDLSHNLVLTLAMTGSSINLGVNLLDGYFTLNTLYYVPNLKSIVIGP